MRGCATVFLLGALAVLAVASCTSVQAQEWSPAAAGLQGYSLAWSDEFNSLDLDTWTQEDQAWPDNDELEYYSPDPKYSRVSDGSLVLTATDDATGGRKFTSARLSTKNSYTFNKGVYAARIKMTKGKGVWPAFWLFTHNGPLYAEWDIAECIGGAGREGSCASLGHFNTKPGEYITPISALVHHSPEGTIMADDYHVFWMEWTDTSVKVGMDTNEAQILIADVSQLAAFQQRMYLIFNVAVGGNYPGNPDDTTPFPQSMYIDWVRVYSKAGESVVTSIKGSTDNSGTDPNHGKPTNPVPVDTDGGDASAASLRAATSFAAIVASVAAACIALLI